LTQLAKSEQAEVISSVSSKLRDLLRTVSIGARCDTVRCRVNQFDAMAPNQGNPRRPAAPCGRARQV
jgi:hypothetical protein